MIHQVRTNRPDYWQWAPKVGLLLFALLLLAPLAQVRVLHAPLGVTIARLEAATTRAIKASGETVLYAPAEVAWYVPADATRVRRQATWQTWTGETVAAAKVFQAPTTALPRSPYGDGYWSPLNDSITYVPFQKPTMGYFVGSVLAATTKGNAQTAVNNAVSTDIVEFQTALSWGRTFITGGGSLAQLIFPARSSGYVMVRDQDTAGTLPAQGQRVTNADFAAANTQSVNASDSMWDFAPQTQGWYFRGLDLKNAHVDNVRIISMGTRNLTTGNYAINVANTPRYIIVEQCNLTNDWSASWTTNCRAGIDPAVEYGYITENNIEGIASNGNESKGINTSQSIGKINVTNNGIEGMTENIMWGGALMLGNNTECAASDIYTARNYLYRRAEWMVFSATAFQYRNHKNFMEHKQGVRHVWERNECSGHSGIGQQHDLQIKHAGQGASDQGKVFCHDVLFRYNRLRKSASPISVATSTNATYTPNGTYRVEIYGNLWWDRNTNYAGTSADRVLLSDIASNVKKVADVYIHHNTYGAQGVSLVFGGNLASNAGSLPNFRYMNNIDWSPTHLSAGVVMSGGTKGVAALNNLSGAGGWQFAGNVGIASAGSWTWSSVPGNYEVSVASLAFVDATNGNYTLVSYSNYTGTDGGAPGVPYAHMDTMLTGVLTGAPA